VQAAPNFQTDQAINFNGTADPLEKALLSTLLDSHELFKEIAEIVEPEDFINDSARKIFSWVAYESKQGRRVDISLAMSHFSKTPRLSSYVIDIGTVFPNQGALKRHAEELRDLSMRYGMIQMLRESTMKLMQGQDPVDQELSLLTRGIQQTNCRMNAGNDDNHSYKDVGTLWRDRLELRAQKGGIPGTSTGYADLDAATSGLHNENLIIVGGRPSMGKTTFMMNVFENVAVNQGIPVQVYSMEMPKEDIYERSVASIGGIDLANLRNGRLKPGDIEKLRIATEKLDSAPLYIDDQPALSLNQIVSRATKAVRDHGVKLILIDYLQLMTLSKHFINNRNEGIGEISRGLKQLARDLKVPVVALSQLSRDLEKRPNKRPINSDLRDSGSIEQDADLIMFVYRDEVYNPETEDKGVVEIIIGKQRNGPLSTVRLGFANGQSRFETISQDGSTPTVLPKVTREQRVRHDKEATSNASHLGPRNGVESPLGGAPQEPPQNLEFDIPF
jgi:replicative DNA helicase